MTDADRAKRILDALRSRPGVFWELAQRMPEQKVLGPWVQVAHEWWCRHTPNGEERGATARRTVGSDTWEYTAPAGATPAMGFPSLMVCRAAADRHLESEGFVLAGETGHELGPWVDDGPHDERRVPRFHREDRNGEVVAWVEVSNEGGWCGVIWGEYLEDERGMPERLTTATAARDMVDRGLEGHGFELAPTPDIGYWKPVPDRADMSSARYDIDGVVKASVRVVGNRASGYFAEVEGERVVNADGEPVECVSDGAARRVADKELRRRGHLDSGVVNEAAPAWKRPRRPGLDPNMLWTLDDPTGHWLVHVFRNPLEAVPNIYFHLWLPDGKAVTFPEPDDFGRDRYYRTEAEACDAALAELRRTGRRWRTEETDGS